MIITVNVGAEETKRRAPRAAPDGFDFDRVLDSVGRSEIKVAHPLDRIIGFAMTNLNMRMSLWRITSGYRLIIDVSIINCAIRIDRN